MIINGGAIDTRLKGSLLLDLKLQRRLSGDEFRSFINLMVWTVSLVSDGVFHPDDAEMVMDRAHLDAFVKHGLIEPSGDEYRIHPDYQQWQSTKADLEKMARRRQADRVRKQAERSGNASPANPDDYEDEQPF